MYIIGSASNCWHTLVIMQLTTCIKQFLCLFKIVIFEWVGLGFVFFSLVDELEMCLQEQRLSILEKFVKHIKLLI